MFEILQKICDGNGEEEDLEKLEKLAVNIKKNIFMWIRSNCSKPGFKYVKVF